MKDFDKWNSKKKKIDTYKFVNFYHSRDIWWCSLGVNVGFEQDGKGKNYRRPVLIVRGLSKETCIIVPLTTSTFEHKYKIDIGIVNGKKCKAHISQIRVIDTKRFVNKIGELDVIKFEHIRKSIRNLF